MKMTGITIVNTVGPSCDFQKKLFMMFSASRLANFVRNCASYNDFSHIFKTSSDNLSIAVVPVCLCDKDCVKMHWNVISSLIANPDIDKIIVIYDDKSQHNSIDQNQLFDAIPVSKLSVYDILSKALTTNKRVVNSK